MVYGFVFIPALLYYTWKNHMSNFDHVIIKSETAYTYDNSLCASFLLLLIPSSETLLFNNPSSSPMYQNTHTVPQFIFPFKLILVFQKVSWLSYESHIWIFKPVK